MSSVSETPEHALTRLEEKLVLRGLPAQLRFDLARHLAPVMAIAGDAFARGGVLVAKISRSGGATSVPNLAINLSRGSFRGIAPMRCAALL